MEFQNREFLTIKLKEIYKFLKETDSTMNPNIGTISGLSGIAIFYFYYGKYFNNPESSEEGKNLISHCVNKINSGYLNPSYCYGIPGFGWALDHLSQFNFIDTNTDDFLNHFDQYIFKEAEVNLNQKNYDFLHGAIGQGMYFLNRFETTLSTDLRNSYISYLITIIEGIKSIAEKDKSGYKWIHFLDQEKNEPVFNLSLSHGQAGIIMFLTYLSKYSEFKTLTIPILKKSADYLLSFFTLTSSMSVFPNWVSQSGSYDCNSRLGWCYGDLGIALSLWHAGDVLKDKRYSQISKHLMNHASMRKDIIDTKVIDAGICHGAFGNAKIFDQFHKLTGDLKYNKTKKFWIENGLSLGDKKEGAAGYKMWIGGSNTWAIDTNVLGGVSGIGLSMLDLMENNFSNRWDKCLMLS